MAIEIDQVYVYEPEACDCCRGYYELEYELTVNGEYIARYRNLHDLLVAASSRTMELDYNETEEPEYDNDD